MKKLLASLLSVMMVMCFMPGLAWADAGTTATEIKATDTALEAGNYVLNDDITLTSGALTIDAGKDVTIDLNGHKLTNKSGDHTIVNSGTLTITDSSEGATGTVDNVSHQRAAICNNVGATATILAGNFTRSEEAGKDAKNDGGNSWYVLFNQGTMTIGTENGDNNKIKVEANGKFSSLVENGWQDGTKNTGGNASVLTIHGGTFIGGINTIKNDDCGILAINDGTFKNTTQASFLNWNVATVNGGTFESEVNAILNGHINETIDKGQLTINGGTFVSNKSTIERMTGSGSTHIGNVTITGGTFTSKNMGDTLVADKGLHESGATGGSIIVTGGTFSSDFSKFVPDGLIAVGSGNNWTIGVDEDNTGAIAVAEDFGLWGDKHPGWYNVGWMYGDSFNTDLITGIKVYITDAAGKEIVTYTASGEQLVYQKNNGYISDSKKSSAPFYKTYNGEDLVEGVGENWTVKKGEAFDAFAAEKAYIEITVGDAVVKLENPCTHKHEWATGFTVDKEATASESGEKSKHCNDDNCIARSEITVIPKTSTGGGGYIPPTTQKPVIESDANATVTLSDYGTKATIKVADGYELVDVTVNGVSKGKVDTLTGLKTGDKVVVTTKKIDTTADEIAAVKATKLVARSANAKAPSGKKAIKVYWFNKDGSELNFDGYEIYRSTKKNSGYGKKPIYTAKKTQYFNTSAKKGTRYYYKVRGYKVIGGETYYTDYSLKAIRTAK